MENESCATEGEFNSILRAIESGEIKLVRTGIDWSKAAVWASLAFLLGCFWFAVSLIVMGGV